MQGLLEGKVAVITGAASGVGHESAMLFARHGAKLLALDIDQAGLDALVAEVEGEGGTIASGICDVSDAAAVTAAVAHAVELYGRLDVMFNNAGVTARIGQDFLDGTVEELLKLTAINVGGVVNGCQAAVRQFRAQGDGGVIVNTSSLAGLIGYGSPIYGSTKGAVTTLTRTLALQYSHENIRINAVCPAAMLTNFGIKEGFVRTKELEDWSASMFPIRRNIDAMECAKAALFLASDLSSALVGVNLPVDGGIHAGVKFN